MIGPRNGGDEPEQCRHGDEPRASTRRRASLKTQNAVASQNTPTKNSARLRATAQVMESKKLDVGGDHHEEGS